jgi:hypothetical protein
MGMSVLLGLLAALGVLVVLVVLTKLVRMLVRSSDESDVPRAWRQNTTALRATPVAKASNPPTAEPKGRSVAVKKSHRREEERSDRPKPEAPPDENVEVGTADYARLGEQVTAVLTTAEQAAAEIRESARRDAEQLRLHAEQGATAARVEAEALRADADAYREQTRAAADTYAADTRRTADEEAAKARSALGEEARSVREEAKRKAAEIEAEALQRREALIQSAAHLEERIAGMAITFRGLTAELEDLLPPKRRPAGEPSAGERADGAGDEALGQALQPERAAPR